MTTVTGYDFKGYLKQRITLFAEEQDTGAQGYDVISGSTETVMKHYIQNNASEPSDANRKIPGMTVAEDGQRGLEADSYMARLENLSDVEESICTNADVGYTVDADSYTVEAGSIEEYGTDYSLGDVVTVKDIARGKSVDKVITQAVKSISGAEKSLKLTFGDQKRKLLSGINENVERAMRDIKKIVMDKAAKEDVKQAAQGIKSESEKLSELMANALGVYRTIQSSEDGSEVYYLHDAPTMAESTVIWEFNAGAFAVSTDGGQTWNSGVTADGSIVTKIIETTKIVSDVKSELTGQIGEVQSKIAEIDLNAEDISLKVQNILDNGVDKVVTELLGSGRRRLRRELQKRTGKSARQIKRLLKQAAETSYGDDIRRLSAGVPFEKNDTVQQIIAAELKLADESFRNITQTLGFVDPYGHASELTDAYRKCCDFAFNQVAFGATDYNTAVRQATKNLADKGVRVIDYDSGMHTSAEAAVRRNIMSGLGSMNEKISEQNHDDMGANGWEISAHAASAPDHELIQGRQYTDAAYQRLNNSLVRRIGTLNCGHTAFPIVLGVSQPQYTDAQLEQIRQDNATGVTVNGRHYTTYEATQQQRAMERTMRRQKRRIVVDDAAGDKDKLLTDQIRLGQQNAQYRSFSRAAGLRTQEERANVAGFTAKQGTAASKLAQQEHTKWLKSIGAEDSDLKTLDKYYESKYDNSPAYQLLTGYNRAVEKGDISPLVSLDVYQQTAHEIQSRIVGQMTSTGIQIDGFATHFIDCIIGQTSTPHAGMRCGVSIDDALDALQNTVKAGNVRTLDDGDIRQTLYGKSACVTFSIRDKKLIQTNPWKENKP